MAEVGATSGNESAAAGLPGDAIQQVLPVRELVLASRFFGERHGDGAAQLAAFLHGGLNAWELLRAWYGEALGELLAGGRD